jgi:hypothetical protein
MDLTNGFWQVPLADFTRQFTAFITVMGVFMYTRLPQGLKAASAYFQMQMATVVLADILYRGVELYIDDCLIHAATFPEFKLKLTSVLERFKKFNIKVNPKKCRIGMNHVEYVGHVLNNEGITFSQAKREKVFNIPRPSIAKHLKSFLGAANYFQTHIKNYAIKAKPLFDMIRNYERNKRLEWTADGANAWDVIRHDIEHCPTLFFLREGGEIVLSTDASDYGIGAMLVQRIDGVDYPIAFMSRSLQCAELNWNTTEKECFAIVMALKKFEHLIRDCKFTILTDHKNLTYMTQSRCQKVQRWKSFIHLHDCTMQYIEGEINVVPDAFSRLVTPSTEALCLLDEFGYTKEQANAISRFHNCHIGHGGVERTLNRLKDPASGITPWTHMKEHVRRFIRRCPNCQKMSQIKTPIHTLPFTQAAYEIMERLGIDYIGPFPPDEFGNTYICVIIDCHSRWVELYATKSNDAKSTARAVYDHFGRYGSANQLLSDNGSHFVNEVIDELMKLMDMPHVRTVAYSQQENTIIERQNKAILHHLRALVNDK